MPSLQRISFPTTDGSISRTIGREEVPLSLLLWNHKQLPVSIGALRGSMLLHMKYTTPVVVPNDFGPLVVWIFLLQGRKTSNLLYFFLIGCNICNNKRNVNVKSVNELHYGMCGDSLLFCLAAGCEMCLRNIPNHLIFYVKYHRGLEVIYGQVFFFPI